MNQPQLPSDIAEGDVVLIRALVRHVWHDAVVVRIPIGAGSSAFHQLSVAPGSVVGHEVGKGPAAVDQV